MYVLVRYSQTPLIVSVLIYFPDYPHNAINPMKVKEGDFHLIFIKYHLFWSFQMKYKVYAVNHEHTNPNTLQFKDWTFVI